MNLRLLLLFPFFLLVNFTIGQNCLPDGITITTQSEMDDFLTTYANCTNIEGAVIVEGPEITNLLGLQNIISIEDAITIRDAENLTSLAGLENLTTIGDKLWIIRINNLTDLTGLENLTTLLDGLFILENEQLTSLNGLNNLTTFSGDINLSDNPTLNNISVLNNITEISGFLYINRNNFTDLSGLENLTSIGRTLTIISNTQLTSLSGLSNLTSVGDDIWFLGNDNLTSFSGLNNLTTIGGQLKIQRVEGLTTLSGLENLISIGDRLEIQRNTVLTDLSVLENLTVLGDEIEITDNPILEVCNISSICSFIEDGGNVEISDNAPGCNSVDEVALFCEVGRIAHPIFYDLNENGSLDEGEPFYGDASVNINAGESVSFGNLINGGLAYISLGDYTVSLNTLDLPFWELTTSSSYNVSLTEDNPTATVFFGIKPTFYYTGMAPSMATGNLRCNDSQIFNVYGENTGTNLVDGTLWLEVDPSVTSIDYVDLPDTIVAPNKYGWHFKELYPSGIVHKQIRLGVPGPPDFAIGNSLLFQTYLDYTDLIENFTSYIFKYNEIVECSYDPNDKLVNPVYPMNYALIGEPLTYTIRFQNTGNAEAYDVVIRDTLDPNLDPATFRMITSSHNPVLTTQLKDEQYLTFSFIDIFLPDSTTNFEESQGFVMYSIQAYEDIPEETEITNTAGIYFDFNPPIITNTTENTMLYSFDSDEDGFEIFIDCDDHDPLAYPDAIEIPNNDIDEDCDGEDLVDTAVNLLENIAVSLFPNPTSGNLLIKLPIELEGALTLKDYTGKTILTQMLKEEQQLDLSNLPAAVYLLEIKTANENWIELVVKM